MARRSVYLGYLNFQMQNMKITEPFNMDPPKELAEANRLFSVKML
jgi:hypothetical protein